MTATLRTIEAGQPEADIAARLLAEGSMRRCIVPISLIAADERIAKFRHPLPTEATLLGGGLQERKVRGYVMVVLCLIKEGLVASITRFRRVGDVPEGVPDAYNRVCGVDAIMQEATQPGKTLGDVFAACQKAYADLGFPATEWHNHHQGGAGGYAGRTCKGTPGETFPILDARWSGLVRDIAGVDVQFGHAFAWNPSAVGVKSEDTFIMLPDGAKEIVTLTPALPRMDLAAVLGRKTDVKKSGMATG
jgi:antitoxin VapB